MRAFFEANQTVIFAVMLVALVIVLTWLSVEVTLIYSDVHPLLNSGLGQALSHT